MSKLLFDNLSPGLGDLPNQSANKFMELLLDFFLSRFIFIVVYKLQAVLP